MDNQIFDNINGYSLDKEQRNAIVSNKNTLVVAGAGSGKTLTIIGKIKYLIEVMKINYKEILCISFTNEAVNNIKERLGLDIDCYTFHKLALEILKDNHVFYQVASSDMLEYTVNEYFEGFIEDEYIKYITGYFVDIAKDNDINIEKIKDNFSREFESYKKLIIKFISKIKSNNIDDFSYIKKKLFLSYKHKCFLIIMFHIYKFYLEELNSSLKIDFDMMISLASKSIKDKGIKKYYKYIIIDEYQDISLVRYQLVKSIMDECDSRVFAVGDDFQSIYGFSGSNLELFVNFKKYYSNSKIYYLKNTYRNSIELIRCCNHFIKKNPYQLSKRLVSSKRNKNPLKIVYYTRSNYKYKFRDLLDLIYESGVRECLILGRCNHDLDLVWNGDLVYKDMNLRFLTVHSSKGLESECVIVLNLSDELLGFPNKMEDDKIINIFFKNKEKYKYAEERRLFYVALTRTKNDVYLMVKKDKESMFIKEIKYRCMVYQQKRVN